MRKNTITRVAISGAAVLAGATLAVLGTAAVSPSTARPDTTPWGSAQPAGTIWGAQRAGIAWGAQPTGGSRVNAVR